MRKAWLFVWSAVLATAVSAAPLVKVAFLGIEPVGVGESAASGISESLLNELINTNRFTIVERDRINALLEEQGLSLSGCTTTECYVKVGQLTGAEKVLVGTLSQLERLYILNVRIVDVCTGTIELSDSEKAYSLDALLSQTRDVARRLAAKIPVTGTVISVGADTLKIDMGYQEGVTVGTDLVVLRYGEEYYHPETGLLLGRDVEELGYVEITKVLANELSEARLVGTFSPQVGDNVRLAEHAAAPEITPVVEPTVEQPVVEPTEETPSVSPSDRFMTSVAFVMGNAAFTDSRAFEYVGDLEVSTWGFGAGFGYFGAIDGGFCLLAEGKINYYDSTVDYVGADLTVDFVQMLYSALLDFQFYFNDEPLRDEFSMGIGVGLCLDLWKFLVESGNSFTYDSHFGLECSLNALFGCDYFLRLEAHVNTSTSYTGDDSDATVYEHQTPLIPISFGFEFGFLY